MSRSTHHFASSSLHSFASISLQGWITRYGFTNSKTDLFSESANSELAWGKGKDGEDGTTRTTARFVPGFDWDKKKGAFDDAADKAEEAFESMFENWTPDVED